jgi:acetyl esterase/lipase
MPSIDGRFNFFFTLPYKKTSCIRKIFVSHSAIIILLFFSEVAFAQKRFVDTIYHEIQKKTLVYADTLKLDFYEAKNDISTNKPLIILVHGGGFVAGRRDGGEETNFSSNMAKKGYAVASISYRLTMKGKSFGCDCPAAAKIKTYVEAVEDVVRALWFITRYAIDFRIDPKKIILVGSSAGAETILNTIGMKNNYLFKHIAYPKATIIGAVSLSGAMLDRDYLITGEAVPTLFLHGKSDIQVPYATAAHHSCKPADVGYLLLDGPFEIAKRLKELNQSYLLLTDPSGGHEWADIGYQKIDVIADFLFEHVLKNELIQVEGLIAKPSDINR